MRLYIFFRDAAANPFSDLTGMMHLCLWQEYNEFLATVPSNRFAHPQLSLNDFGDALQHFITRLMTVRVIDALEFVDVEKHADQWMLVSASLACFNLTAVFEVTAVLYSGQCIGQPNQLQTFP